MLLQIAKIRKLLGCTAVADLGEGPVKTPPPISPPILGKKKEEMTLKKEEKPAGQIHLKRNSSNILFVVIDFNRKQERDKKKSKQYLSRYPLLFI